ncbi:hypothetical protein O3P69_016391 [Scylla paramamosain]|uniref:Uncharacterized protein n=1 Tax=Scylla paramamosain TaxID=85552 RepID=A0AAW0TE32_SCYPA
MFIAGWDWRLVGTGGGLVGTGRAATRVMPGKNTSKSHAFVSASFSAFFSASSSVFVFFFVDIFVSASFSASVSFFFNISFHISVCVFLQCLLRQHLLSTAFFVSAFVSTSSSASFSISLVFPSRLLGHLIPERSVAECGIPVESREDRPVSRGASPGHAGQVEPYCTRPQGSLLPGSERNSGLRHPNPEDAQKSRLLFAVVTLLRVKFHSIYKEPDCLVWVWAPSGGTRRVEVVVVVVVGGCGGNGGRKRAGVSSSVYLKPGGGNRQLAPHQTGACWQLSLGGKHGISKACEKPLYRVLRRLPHLSCAQTHLSISRALACVFPSCICPASRYLQNPPRPVTVNLAKLRDSKTSAGASSQSGSTQLDSGSESLDEVKPSLSSLDSPLTNVNSHMVQDAVGHTDLYSELSKVGGGANGMSSVAPVPASVSSASAIAAAYQTQLSLAAAAAVAARHTAGGPTDPTAGPHMAPPPHHHDILHDYHSFSAWRPRAPGGASGVEWRPPSQPGGVTQRAVIPPSPSVMQ